MTKDQTNGAAVSGERLAEMLQLAQHCRHGEFAALVEQRDVVLALTELQALRLQSSPAPDTAAFGLSDDMVERGIDAYREDVQNGIRNYEDIVTSILTAALAGGE